MTIQGETRRQIVAPVGELLAGACLVLADLAGKGYRTMAAARRALATRRLLQELGSLDDHMLRDIGITRADLRDAAAAPPFQDPSRLLVMRSVERRAAARLKARAPKD